MSATSNIPIYLLSYFFLRFRRPLPCIKPPMPGFRGELAGEYLSLWREWARDNPTLLAELRELAIEAGGILTDQFATGFINQAWALSTILNGAPE